MSKTITVTGATGNIGRPLVEALLERGHSVRAVGRDAGRLAPLAERGAEPTVGSVADAAFLADAYRGADAVFAMIPPNQTSSDYLVEAARVASSQVEALGTTRVGHVVALSSVGAEHGEGTGIVLALHDFEVKLSALGGAAVSVLRPAYFMENLYPQIGLIKLLGTMGGPVAGDILQPAVATRDIAAVAAAQLDALDFQGHRVVYVLGERDLSYNEITRVIGRAIDRDELGYIQFSRDQTFAGLRQMGVSESVAGLLVDLAEGINRGHLTRGVERTPESTTPTRIEDFAVEFAAAMRA